MNKTHTRRYVDIDCVERCPQHSHIIIYYCNMHDEIGCYECMSTNHSACAQESIDKIAKGTKDSVEYEKLLEELVNIKEQAEENLKTAIGNKLNSDICLSTVMRDIRSFRNNIDAHLERMEHEVTEKVKELNLDYQITMNEIVSESKEIRDNSEALSKALTDDKVKETKLFMKMKQMKAQVAKYKHDTMRDKTQRSHSFTFEPNACIADIFRRSKSLGKLLVNNVSNEKETVANRDLKEDVSVNDKKANYNVKYNADTKQNIETVTEILGVNMSLCLGNNGDEGDNETDDKSFDSQIQEPNTIDEETNLTELTAMDNDKEDEINKMEEKKFYAKGIINAKLISDKEQCDISGIGMMSDNEIVLADYNNRSVKVVDVIKNKITDEIKLEYHPYDLTVPSANTVAVTLTNTIQVIKRSQLLRLDETIKVDGECYGITSNRKKFFVSFIKPKPKVEILNHQGDILQTFEIDIAKRMIFKRPRYIDVSPDEKFLYITDFEADSIIRLSTSGEAARVFTDAAILNGPYGIHVGENGHVLVCNYGNDNIIEFNAELSKLKMILSQTEGVESPQSIYMCNKVNKMFIACTDIADCNSVQIFSRS